MGFGVWFRLRKRLANKQISSPILGRTVFSADKKVFLRSRCKSNSQSGTTASTYTYAQKNGVAGEAAAICILEQSEEKKKTTMSSQLFLSDLHCAHLPLMLRYFPGALEVETSLLGLAVFAHSINVVIKWRCRHV
ncbi:hypothetical protein L484_021111 [Morus notabilis]|uniref:Uncharacterized protein n=1 Tax=Morus notabilis TaxID=981085 RepID=W9R9P2_9ROSA|nr:hypothetical protein L484_021111 [Morus notabilis]